MEIQNKVLYIQQDYKSSASSEFSVWLTTANFYLTQISHIITAEGHSKYTLFANLYSGAYSQNGRR